METGAVPSVLELRMAEGSPMLCPGETPYFANQQSDQALELE
jgi:hypothetical protein